MAKRPFEGSRTWRELSKRERIISGNSFYENAAAAAASAGDHERANRARGQIKPVPEQRVRKSKAVSPDAPPLEAAVNDEIYEAAKSLGTVSIWRNNRGVAQYGAAVVRYGVGPNGAADWIGYRRIRITPDMVGEFIAQFAAVEAKRPGERPDVDQQKFIDRVIADGGCAGWADSGARAKSVLRS